MFNSEGDPLEEANQSWLTARRAIVRHPLARIGYGGCLSLAMQFPDFVDRVEEVVAEFRSVHELSGGERPANAKSVVAVLNAWGSPRTWQTHMVAHVPWYKQTYSYQGVIESLAGHPFDVRFISFDDVLNGDGLDGVDVLINAGSRGTAFSGGPAWDNVDLQTRITQFVRDGGGLIGVCEPTASDGQHGNVFVLADVLGVDREIDWSLSTDRYVENEAFDHFITADLSDGFDFGEDPGDIVPVCRDVQVLEQSEGSIRLATNRWGQGRPVYLARLPYSTDNARLLQRAVMWAAGLDNQWTANFVTDNPAVEVAWYPSVERCFTYNSSAHPQTARVLGPDAEIRVELEAGQSRWIDLS